MANVLMVPSLTQPTASALYTFNTAALPLILSFVYKVLVGFGADSAVALCYILRMCIYFEVLNTEALEK